MKFRAWNGSFWEHGGFFVHATGLINPDPLCEGISLVTRHSFLSETTRVTDYAGEHIFTGDILTHTKYPDEDPCFFMIVYHDGSFRRMYLTSEWGDLIMSLPLNKDYIQMLECQIVGNVGELVKTILAAGGII